LQRVVLEQVAILHSLRYGGQENERDELHKEFAVQALFRRDGHPAQIQPFFQIIEGLFNNILVPVDLKRFHSIPYLVAHNGKVTVLQCIREKKPSLCFMPFLSKTF